MKINVKQRQSWAKRSEFFWALVICVVEMWVEDEKMWMDVNPIL